ncbi:MAG: hypothetical protein LBT02_03745 [Rickettsiales bacterium]|jgi:type IV secretory pathway component VirB8|nr:hypothetical protein [Rickettsiales bacterium]
MEEKKINLVGYSSFNKAYIDNIKYNVVNETYFKDGYDFFFVAYLRPIIDRTFFTFIGIVAAFIVWFVVQLVTLILPLQEDIYITIKERDMTIYNTYITDLSKENEGVTTDEHLLRYLLTNYVEERESHNYKTSNINAFNLKMNRIQNSSFSNVNNEFRQFMSKENINGPFYYFGKEVESKVTINNFKFVRIKRNKFVDKVKDFIAGNSIPIGANVYYTLIIQIGDSQTIVENRRTYMEFKYTAVGKTIKGEYTAPKILVTKYINYKLK